VPVNVDGALELDAASDDDVRDVDERDTEDRSADELDTTSSSSEETDEICLEVAVGAAWELPNSVSRVGVGVSLGLGTAPTKLAKDVASAGAVNVKLALSCENRLEASLASVAVVVYVVVM
jgi:hypothetical protein